MADPLSVTLEIDSDTETAELPAALVDLYREEPEETNVEIVADMLVMAFAERAHAIAHHGEGQTDEEIQAIESEMMDRFEEHFGMTYGEATGHSH